MNKEISRKKMLLLLTCGLLGCVLMGGSDWLMIYGDTAFEGELAWLTLGAAAIPAGRNAAALFLAFPAVILYAPALFTLRHVIIGGRYKKNYSGLTALGLTPWLALHLFYVMILFAFGFMMSAGETELAYSVSEAVFGQFSWVIILAEIIMLLPFIYFFVLTIKKRTIFKKAMALNNPLLIYVVLKLITALMPDAPFRLAFTNGLMSEAMFIWFIIYIFALPKAKNKE